MSHPSAIRVDPSDDVLVALEDIVAGAEIEPGLSTAEAIPAKQKVAAREFAAGDEVTMYGVPVGAATEAIDKGGLVHSGNITHKSADFFGKASDVDWSAPDISALTGRTFDGYHRSDGQVGTANHWISSLWYSANRATST